MKTYQQTKEQALASRQWVEIDASGIPLGRLASEVAKLIRGKHKPTISRHIDGGDFVIVTNASQIKLTGNKLTKKIYISHSGYNGGLKERPAEYVLKKHPEFLVESAVKGMLPRGPLGYRLRTKLKVFAGAEHPHAAQQPQKIEIKCN